MCSSVLLPPETVAVSVINGNVKRMNRCLVLSQWQNFITTYEVVRNHIITSLSCVLLSYFGIQWRDFLHAVRLVVCFITQHAK